jgi:hypothetical protein
LCGVFRLLDAADRNGNTRRLRHRRSAHVHSGRRSSVWRLDRCSRSRARRCVDRSRYFRRTPLASGGLIPRAGSDASDGTGRSVLGNRPIGRMSLHERMRVTDQVTRGGCSMSINHPTRLRPSGDARGCRRDDRTKRDRGTRVAHFVLLGSRHFWLREAFGFETRLASRHVAIPGFCKPNRRSSRPGQVPAPSRRTSAAAHSFDTPQRSSTTLQHSSTTLQEERHAKIQP